MADLAESIFRFSDIQAATFISANFEGGQILFSDAAGAVFSNAVLKNANVNQSDLRGALMHGADVSGATLFKVNLEDANLDGLAGWEALEGIEGTNIAGVRNPPDGFVEWAMANGAISEPGALSNLTEAAEEMRRLEETAQ